MIKCNVPSGHMLSNGLIWDAFWRSREMQEEKLERILEVNDNAILGLYSRNRFLIRINHSFLEEVLGTEQYTASNEKGVSIFLHEFLHFLQNVGTFSGVTSFSTFLNLIYCFSKMISTSDGVCIGGLPEDIKDQKTFSETLQLMRLYEGDSKITMQYGKDLRKFDFKVTNIEQFQITKPLSSPMKWMGYTLNLEVNDEEKIVNTTYLFSATAIRESIAAIIQTEFENANNHAVRSKMPPAPYKLLEKVSLHVLKTKIDRMTICKIGILSLLSDNPARDFLFFLSKLKEIMAKGKTEEEAILEITGKWKEVQKVQLNKYPDLIEAAIHSVERRGAISRAVNLFYSSSMEYLKKRIEDPFFELDVLLNKNWFIERNSETMPCIVIENGIMVGFGGMKDSDRNDIQALSSQMFFMLKHLTVSGFRSTSSIGKHTCPFYDGCGIEYKDTFSEICKTSPWEIYAKTKNRQLCPMGHAVQMTFNQER
jgi:hypothetical protein